MTRLELFIKRWAIITIILWLITYVGFIFLGGGFNPFDWDSVQRMNFGSWLIAFGALTAIVSGVSVGAER